MGPSDARRRDTTAARAQLTACSKPSGRAISPETDAEAGVLGPFNTRRRDISSRESGIAIRVVSGAGFGVFDVFLAVMSEAVEQEVVEVGRATVHPVPHVMRL